MPLPRRVLDEAQEGVCAPALQKLCQLRPGLGQERLRDAPVSLNGGHRRVQGLRTDVDSPWRHEATLRNSRMHVSMVRAMAPTGRAAPCACGGQGVRAHLACRTQLMLPGRQLATPACWGCGRAGAGEWRRHAAQDAPESTAAVQPSHERQPAGHARLFNACWALQLCSSPRLSCDQRSAILLLKSNAAEPVLMLSEQNCYGLPARSHFAVPSGLPRLCVFSHANASADCPRISQQGLLGINRSAHKPAGHCMQKMTSVQISVSPMTVAMIRVQ